MQGNYSGWSITLVQGTIWKSGLLKLIKAKKVALFLNLAEAIREAIFTKYMEKFHQGGRIET